MNIDTFQIIFYQGYMNTKQPENLELLSFLLFCFYHNLLLNGGGGLISEGRNHMFLNEWVLNYVYMRVT